jgi:DNA-binding NarL/FixJ family response regulator
MCCVDSSLGPHATLNRIKKAILALEKPMIRNGKPTIVLADDHDRVRKRVSELLGAECCILAEVGDGHSSIEAAERFRPDIIILDLSMPVLDGIQAAREIKRRGLPCKIIFLTVQEDADYVQIAAEINACYILKARMHIDLPLAIKRALAGSVLVSPFSERHVIS